MRNIVGRPVTDSDFFAPSKLLKKINRLITNGNSVLIHGQRKAGKTSLLLHLNALSKTEIPAIKVYVNLESIVHENDFYRRALETMFNAELNDPEQLQAFNSIPNHAQIPPLVFVNALKELGSHHQLIFLLDNCGPNHFLLPTIQTILKDHQLSHIQFIITGTPDMMTLVAKPNAYLNGLQALDITPLTHSEAMSFIKQLESNDGIKIASSWPAKYSKDEQWLTPYHLQLWIQAINDIAIEQNIEQALKIAHIDQAFLRLVEDQLLFQSWDKTLPLCFKNAEYDFAKAVINTLANRQQLALDDIITLARQNNIGNEYKTIVQALLQYGYLARFDNYFYRFNSDLIKAWWREHILDDITQRPTKEFKPITINHFKIKQIKCIDNIDIHFDPMNKTTLLLGTNARGKTTILQLLALGLSGVSNVPFVSAWQQVVKNGHDHGEFELDVTIDQQPLQFGFKVNPDDTITCIKGTSQLESLHDKFLMLAYGANRHIKLEDPRPNKPIEAIATLFGENGFLKHIKVSANYEYVVRHFGAIAPLINAVLKMADISNRVELVDYDASSLYFKTPSSERVPIAALSEGFKSTFVWLFDMIIRIVEKGGDLRHANQITGVVLLDEVDLHLHPSWQRTIVPSLNELFPSIQFIVTSHSPFVAQSINNDHVTSLDWCDDKVTVVEKDTRSEMSYSEMARDIFDIESPFSYATEQKIYRFKQMAEAIRKEQTFDAEAFNHLVAEIAGKGPELEGVMRREIRSLERRTGKEFDLWTK